MFDAIGNLGVLSKAWVMRPLAANLRCAERTVRDQITTTKHSNSEPSVFASLRSLPFSECTDMWDDLLLSAPSPKE